ncbi:MAG: hypothetical protein WCR67_02215 [Bacilli bacterium]
MNTEEKNVMTIVTLARIVESTLWYCLPPRSANGFSKQDRDNRFLALTNLTAEHSPFYANCERNADAGKELFEMMKDFTEDVYGPNGRIVYLDMHDKVVVEPSLINELFTTVVKLRAYLEAFISSAIKFLKESGKLSDEFAELISTDIRYYHAFAGKVSCILIANKFGELNQTASIYMESYAKSHNGADPKNDPDFNVRNDPSFRMIENEFHELNTDMVTVLNSYGENDADFRYAREQIYADCEIFTGKKVTTDTKAYFQMFTSYLDKILTTTQTNLNQMFTAISLKMSETEEEPAKTEESAPAAEEAK